MRGELTDASAPPTTGQAVVRRGIVSAAIIISVGNLLSRLFGLVREQLASYFFGTGVNFRPFTLADSMLSILYDLLISGAVASALVPVLSEYAAPERRAELRRILGTLLTLVLIVLGGVTILLEIFASPLVAAWLRLGADSASTQAAEPTLGTGARSGTAAVESVASLVLTIHNVRLILPPCCCLASRRSSWRRIMRSGASSGRRRRRRRATARSSWRRFCWRAGSA
jgi:hypothetical protein